MKYSKDKLPPPTGRQKDKLKALDVRPSKKRGQNFLTNKEVPKQIADFGATEVSSHVVEIGPGTGALTTHLAHYPNLTLIEIEEKLCAPLAEQFPNAKILNADIRSVDFSELGKNLVVFGNIPYVFSSEIIFHLLKYRHSIQYAILMVQKEFAERIAAKPHTKAYGSMTVAVQLWADISLDIVVPGTDFHPPTQVSSQVMKITFRESPRVVIEDLKKFEFIVRAAFSQRRKKMVNSLVAAARWSKEAIEAAVLDVGLSLNVRAEQVSVEKFGELVKKLRGLEITKSAN